MSRDVATSQLSVTLCSESFWPLFDMSSWWAGDFCRTAPPDCSLRVVTTRPTRDNPELFQWHGVEVQRIYSRPRFNWFRSSRQLLQALSPDAGQTDCLLINQSPQNTMTTLNLARHLSLPAMVRVNELWLEDNKAKRKAEQIPNHAFRTQHPTQFVFPDTSVMKQFKTRNGVVSSVVEDGITIHEPAFERDGDFREIRKSLAEAHPVLQVDADQPLVIVATHFARNPPELQIVNAWRQVRRNLPQARLWIIGEGPGGIEIWNSICRNELTQEIIMPGQFDRVEDLFRMANLFVALEDGLGAAKRFTKLAIAQGVPVLVEKCRAYEWLSDNIEHVHEFQQRGTNDLAFTLIEQLQNTSGESDLKHEVDSEVAEKLQFRQTVEQYISLMKRLVENAGRRP